MIFILCAPPRMNPASSIGFPDQGQSIETRDTGDVLGDLRAGLDAVVGNASVPFLDGNGKFDSREVRPEAPMWSGTEREMAVLRTIDHELARIGKLPGVAARRSGGQHDTIADLHRAAGKVDVAGDNPRRGDNRVIAKKFLDRIGNRLGMFAQLRAMTRIFGEMTKDVGEHAG